MVQYNNITIRLIKLHLRNIAYKIISSIPEMAFGFFGISNPKFRGFQKFFSRINGFSMQLLKRLHLLGLFPFKNNLSFSFRICFVFSLNSWEFIAVFRDRDPRFFQEIQWDFKSRGKDFSWDGISHEKATNNIYTYFWSMKMVQNSVWKCFNRICL